MSDDNVKPVIEALLFASERPLTLEQIKNVLEGLGTDQIRGVLEGLKREYEKDNRGIRINEVAGGFQMITAPGFASFLKKLYKERRVERLSRPALETLAIVAYKQPVSRMEIGFLRNVNVDGVVKHLLERNLIRIAGRRKAPGRPYVFGTTRKFLEYFGLKSLEELPKLEEFKKLTTEGIDESKEPAQKN